MQAEAATAPKRDYKELCKALAPLINASPVDYKFAVETRCREYGKTFEQMDADIQSLVSASPLEIARRQQNKEEDYVIDVPDWPAPPAKEAFAGLVGGFCNLWDPHTEASLVALAVQFLVAYGHSIGNGAFFPVGADDHHTNEMLALVGPTSFARKGSSFNCVTYTFRKVLLDLGISIIDTTGLSSGEGLIHAVRDTSTSEDKKGNPVVIKGVTDKRLLVFEPEFASVLRRMKREGNTVSELIRQAWDDGNLGTMTRNNPLHATNAHISLVAHVTPSDLQLYLDYNNTMNGFANRFMFVATRREKSLSNPGRPSEVAIRAFVEKLAAAIEFGAKAGEMKRSPEAEAEWDIIYTKLNTPRTGRQHNAIAARAAAHVLRLSMIYALLEKSTVIEVCHQASALSMWEFSERTSRFVFGDSLGDKVAEKILELLREAPKGLTTREIFDKVAHSQRKQVPDALRLLIENEQILKEDLKPCGQRWFIK